MHDILHFIMQSLFLSYTTCLLTLHTFLSSQFSLKRWLSFIFFLSSFQSHNKIKRHNVSVGIYFALHYYSPKNVTHCSAILLQWIMHSSLYVWWCKAHYIFPTSFYSLFFLLVLLPNVIESPSKNFFPLKALHTQHNILKNLSDYSLPSLNIIYSHTQYINLMKKNALNLFSF